MIFNPRIFYQAEGMAEGGDAAVADAGEEAASGEPAAPEPSSGPGLLADQISTSEPGTEETPEADATPQPGEPAKRPANIPEQFWDVTTGTLNQDGIAKGYNDLRKEFNKLTQEKGKMPETAEGYLEDFKPPHRHRPGEGEKEGAEFERYGEIQADQPVFLALAKAAKNNSNMSPAQFQDFVQDVMEDLHGVLPEPYNEKKEMELLGDGAEQILKVNGDWASGLVSRGALNEDEFNLLLSFGSTALGVGLVNKLRLNSGEKPIPVSLNGNANNGRKTPDECAALMAKETADGQVLYEQDTPEGKAWREIVDKHYAETFGTDFEG